jgi:hypothetical protein
MVEQTIGPNTIKNDDISRLEFALPRSVFGFLKIYTQWIAKHRGITVLAKV